MPHGKAVQKPWRGGAGSGPGCMSTGEKVEDKTSVLRIWVFIPWPADDGASTAKDSDNDSDNESSSDSD